MKIHQHKPNALFLEFDNGITISTIWGYASYSDNYDMPELDIPGADLAKLFNTPHESGTVEVMIGGPKEAENYLKRIHREFDGDGSVIGYIPIDKWARLIGRLSRWKGGETN